MEYSCDVIISRLFFKFQFQKGAKKHTEQFQGQLQEPGAEPVLQDQQFDVILHSSPNQTLDMDIGVDFGLSEQPLQSSMERLAQDLSLSQASDSEMSDYKSQSTASIDDTSLFPTARDMDDLQPKLKRAKTVMFVRITIY